MHYAKKGIITPEMEYVSIRENQKIHELLDNKDHFIIILVNNSIHKCLSNPLLLNL